MSIAKSLFVKNFTPWGARYPQIFSAGLLFPGFNIFCRDAFQRWLRKLEPVEVRSGEAVSICHIELVLIKLHFKCSEQEFSDKIIKCKMLNVETLFQLWLPLGNWAAFATLR